MTGLIVKHTGSNYMIRSDNGQLFLSTVRGKLRLKDMRTTNPIAVGDKVTFDAVSETEGVITGIEPRKNYIIRRSTNLSRQAHILAANIDRVFLIVTLTQPETRYEFIDRFLVTAEAYKIPVRIVINKIDLLDTKELQEELEYFKSVYSSAGYSILEVSALKNINIDKIKAEIPEKISLFSGNSGVGKSAIMNSLSVGLNRKTGEISKAHNKGTHTTTFYEMFEIDNGFIIDSPGIKGFGLIDIDKSEVYHFFPEIFRVSAGCKFGMCSHTHEPECAVKAAVESGEISESRYISYLKILEGNDDKYRKN
ncbi:MAG: ribosome small subunit-dependent GTPase A [Prevotellaceae bacterium]|jgi:ribosome biogenesis GTPase|nr:ribosome small subunit-dependent GTPase A [Prevotellaceae bacterium]